MRWLLLVAVAVLGCLAWWLREVRADARLAALDDYSEPVPMTAWPDGMWMGVIPAPQCSFCGVLLTGTSHFCAVTPYITTTQTITTSGGIVQ